MTHLSRAPAFIFATALTTVSMAGDRNTTGLPTYPSDNDGVMDDVYRSLPNGQHCTHYAGDTTDALRDVEAWYKKQMPNARTDDVNKDSLYVPIQLDGIKLVSGNDIINVYRAPHQSTTSIEIFKCKDAPHG